MEKLSIKEVAAACGGTLLWGDENTIIEGVTTDSRKSAKICFLFRLRGRHLTDTRLPRSV